MTPHKYIALRTSSFGSLVLEPVRSAADTPAAARLLAAAAAVVAFVVHDIFLVLLFVAVFCSSLDYAIGRRLADHRGDVDEMIAARGLQIKLTAILLLLLIYLMDTWAFSRWGIDGGYLAAACAAIWIHKELKSIDRLTDGDIPFITPFLVVLDAIIGRLLPTQRRADPEPGVAEFIQRRLDAANRGEEPPVRREYDKTAVELERDLPTPNGKVFHDVVQDRDER